MSLNQAKLLAQRTANRDHKTMTLWNLNRFNPLYVVREYRAGDEAKYGYVMRFYEESIVK